MATMAQQPLWIDVSKWQEQLHYTAISSKVGDDEVHGIFSRAGWGENGGYIDHMFERNWRESGNIGVYRSSYFAYWAYYPIQRQIDLWYTANPTIDFIPRMLDLEMGNAPAEFIAEETWKISEIIRSRDGFRPIIYSRVDLLEKWLTPFWTSEMMNAHKFMLAQYDFSTPENPSEYNGIVVPDKVEPANILWKQTSPHIELYPSSGPVDRDRWIWTDVETMHDDLAIFWGSTLPVVPPTPPIIPENPECCEKISISIDEINIGIDNINAKIDNINVNTNNLETKTNSLRTDGAVGNLAAEHANYQSEIEECYKSIELLEQVIDNELDEVWSELGKHEKEINIIKLKIRIFEWIKRLFGKDEG